MSSTDLDSDAPCWRKSIRSVNHGACVEVALVAEGIAVRDSADAGGCVISYPRAVWLAFVSRLKSLIVDGLTWLKTRCALIGPRRRVKPLAAAGGCRYRRLHGRSGTS